MVDRASGSRVPSGTTRARRHVGLNSSPPQLAGTSGAPPQARLFTSGLAGTGGHPGGAEPSVSRHRGGGAISVAIARGASPDPERLDR